jgi:cell division protein FtsB
MSYSVGQPIAVMERPETPSSSSLLIRQMLTEVRSREGCPPDLLSYCGSSPSQQLIARNLHSLFSSEGRQDVELVLRSFVHALLQTPNAASDLSVSQLDSTATMRREHEAETDRLRAENEGLHEDIRSLRDQLQIRSFADERSRAELSNLSRDLLERTTEAADLRDRLDSKTAKIAALERNLREKAIQVQELLCENGRLEALANAPRQADPGEAVSSLVAAFERQFEEIVELRGSSEKAIGVISKQSDLIDKFSRCLTELSDRNRELEFIEQQFLQKKPENELLGEVFGRLQELTSCAAADELPEFVEKLISNGMKENRRLRRSFTKLLRFLASLVGSPLLNANATELQDEISRCRRILVENSIIAETEEEEEEDVGENVDVVDVLRTNLLIGRCRKLQDDVDILQKVAAIFQFSGDLNEFPDFVESALAKPASYLRALKLLSGKDNEDKMVAWIELTVTAHQQFQKDLAEIIQFDGDLAAALEFIRNLRKKREEGAELRREFSAGSEELARQKAQSDSTVESLTAQIEVLKRRGQLGR